MLLVGHHAWCMRMQSLAPVVLLELSLCAVCIISRVGLLGRFSSHVDVWIGRCVAGCVCRCVWRGVVCVARAKTPRSLVWGV